MSELQAVTATDMLRKIDAELHMATRFGCEVGQAMDTITSEHIHTAKALLETLLRSQVAGGVQ